MGYGHLCFSGSSLPVAHCKDCSAHWLKFWVLKVAKSFCYSGHHVIGILDCSLITLISVFPHISLGHLQVQLSSIIMPAIVNTC